MKEIILVVLSASESSHVFLQPTHRLINPFSVFLSPIYTNWLLKAVYPTPSPLPFVMGYNFLCLLFLQLSSLYRLPSRFLNLSSFTVESSALSEAFGCIPVLIMKWLCNAIFSSPLQHLPLSGYSHAAVLTWRSLRGDFPWQSSGGCPRMAFVCLCDVKHPLRYVRPAFYA